MLKNILTTRVTKKEFLKKLGIGLLITPILANVVSAKTLFRGDAINLQDLSPDFVVVTDGDKNLASSIVTTTELSYVSGVTSSIQDQFDALASNMDGGNANSIYLLTQNINGGNA